MFIEEISSLVYESSSSQLQVLFSELIRQPEEDVDSFRHTYLCSQENKSGVPQIQPFRFRLWYIYYRSDNFEVLGMLWYLA